MLELVVVMVIVAILATLSVPLIDVYRRRAERLACVANLRSLHGSFSSYIVDNRGWPQVPGGLDSERSFYKFWISVMGPYGGTLDVWICPTEKRLVAADPEADGTITGSYVPTQFDDHEFSPYRWNQPWLLEKADYHGEGSQMIMPDGSVITANQIFGSSQQAPK